MEVSFLKCVFSLLFVIKIIVGPPAFADGIYVTEDLKHAKGDHTVIVLNEQQIKDVERLRQVVLTDEQMKPLRAIYKKTPSKLEVLSSRWDECTCFVGLYAIWCRIGELDVPHSRLEAEERSENFLEEHPQPENEENDLSFDSGESEEEWSAVGADIILDSKGDMYLDGKRISRKELRKKVDEIRSVEVRAMEIYRYINFDLPPPISEDVDKRIYDLVLRTNAFCKEKKVNFHAMGMKLEDL